LATHVLPIIEKTGGKNAVCFEYKPEDKDERRAFAFTTSFNADQKAVQQNCGYGGGTHMSVTPCSYCSARGGQLGLPSLYRCSDCVVRDILVPVVDRLICRHTDFIHSEKLKEIKGRNENEELVGWNG
jgi:hypothetical protein